jgi:excisionase family DNA binding protein
MEQLQFISTTPEELKKAILDGVDERIEELKEKLQPKEPKQLMTRGEVEKFLNVSRPTLHRWTNSGKLRAYGIGNRVYYKREEIEAALIEISPRRAKQ